MKAIITLTDVDDRKVDVRLQFDPPLATGHEHTPVIKLVEEFVDMIKSRAVAGQTEDKPASEGVQP